MVIEIISETYIYVLTIMPTKFQHYNNKYTIIS